MWLPLSVLALVISHAALVSTQESQIPLQDSRSQTVTVKRVAIIGAGSSGASAAYYLRRYADNASIPIELTVYERNSYIGGRSATVHPYDDPNVPPLELGGSIFVKVNHNLVSAVKEFNLSTTGFKPESSKLRQASAPALGVFDGEKLVLVQQNDDPSYWDLTKLLWRYGLAPIKVRNVMKRTVAKFLKMYDKPVFPFQSITEAVQEIGLEGVVAVTGESYLKRWELWNDFSWDVVQAATRVNYASNLDSIHGVEAMVSMAAEGAMSVVGGNWQIFAHMIGSSGTKLMLNTEVVSVSESVGGLTVSARDEDKGTTFEHEFDEIILAAPNQYTKIDWSKVLKSTPDEIPYVNLHTTLFTSRRRLSPIAFGLEQDAIAPEAILTTMPRNESGHAVAPDFFSISLLREVVNPKTSQLEFAYKIFTSEAVNSTFLARMLQLGDGWDADAAQPEADVSWLYRKLWQSYPVELPRVTFEETMLADHVWYTSGMDSFISTMETNSLMGKNVARLMVDEWELNGAAGLEDFDDSDDLM